MTIVDSLDFKFQMDVLSSSSVYVMHSQQLRRLEDAEDEFVVEGAEGRVQRRRAQREGPQSEAQAVAPEDRAPLDAQRCPLHTERVVHQHRHQGGSDPG